MKSLLISALIGIGLSAQAATQYANGSGGFTWDNGSTAKWASASGGAYTGTWTSGNDAVFEGTAGTVTLSSPTAHNLTFNTTGYILSGGSTLTLNGSAPTFTISSGISATIGNNTASVIGGSAGMNLAGAGTLTLSGSAVNTFTGGLNVGSGVGGGTLILNFANVATPTDLINNGNALTLGGGNLTIQGKASGTTAQTLNGTTFNAGSNIITNKNNGTSSTLNLGNITRNPGSVVIFSPGVNWPASPTFSTTEIINCGNVTYDGVSYPTSSTLHFIGGGMFTTQSGILRLLQAGTGGQLALAPGSTAWPDTGAGSSTLNYSITGNKTLDVNKSLYSLLANIASPSQVSLAGFTLTLNSMFTIGSVTLTLAQTGSGGSVQVGNEKDLVLATMGVSGGFTISAPIIDSSAGASSVTVNMLGGGTVTLSGANSYTGTTYMNIGTLTLGAANTLPSGSSLEVRGGTVGFTTFNQSVNAVTLIGGTISGSSGTLTSASTFDLRGGTVSAILAGSVGATKTTSSTVTLNAANTYSGTTTISAGTLALGASASLNNASSVSIAAGASFDVSAITTYTWGSSASLTATGTSVPAILKGGTAVNLGARPATFNFTPTSFTGDSTHPALKVSAGTLNLGTSTITVVNNGGSPLDAGDYTLISSGVDNSSTPTLATGTGVGAGTGLVSGGSATLIVSSGSLILRVTGSSNVAPVITVQPTNTIVLLGNNASFAVTATGSPVPAYQWYVITNSLTNVIGGATSSGLTISGATLGQSGNQYFVIITNVAGSVTSSVVTLTVTTVAPTITVQPANISVPQSINATFNVTAGGVPSPGYQWYVVAGSTTNVIGGATASSLTVSNTVPGQSGNQYFVIATNVGGSVTSSPALLTVVPYGAYTIGYWRFDNTNSLGFDFSGNGRNLTPTNNPVSTTLGLTGPGSGFPKMIPQTGVTNMLAVTLNGTNSLLFAAGGAGFQATNQLTAEVYFNLNSQPGVKTCGMLSRYVPGTSVSWLFGIRQEVANGPIYLRALISPNSDASGAVGQNFTSLTLKTNNDYYAAMVFSNGTATVYLADLSTNNATLSSQQLSGFPATMAANATPFKVGAGESVAPSYYFDGTIDEVRLANLALNTNLFLLYSGVTNAPLISSQPQNQTVVYTSAATFSAVATAFPAPSYQWYVVTNSVTNQLVSASGNDSTAILTLPNPTVSQSGNQYFVVFTNSSGSVTSSLASLTITKATPIAQTATTASDISYGQTLGSSTISVGSFTNAQGSTVAISSYGFVNPSIAPNAGTTNVAVYYLPTDSANYVNVTNTVSVTVSPAALSITANNDSKVYGQTKTYGAGSTNFISSGLQNSETVGSVTITATSSPTNGTAATDNVGSYVLTPSAVTGGTFNPANYSINYNTGTLSVIQASTFVEATSTHNPSGYKDTVSYTATLPSDATGNVVFSSTNGAFSTNAVSSGTATSLSITNLPRGTNVITVAYLGDGNYLGSTTNLEQVVTNHPPVANVMTVTRTAGLALIIALSDVATNWTDSDSDHVSLTGVTMQSTNGVNLFPLNWTTNLDGTIVTTNSYAFIGYTNSPNVADQISYNISDGQGGTNIGFVNIVIQSSVTGTNSITGHDFSSPYSNTVTAYGIPYFYYTLERSTNLTSPVWVDVSTNQAASNGVINAVDTFWDLGGVKPSPSAFYQLKWQP